MKNIFEKASMRRSNRDAIECEGASETNKKQEEFIRFPFEGAEKRGFGPHEVDETINFCLEEVELYLREGRYLEARVITEAALEIKPNHPILLDTLRFVVKCQEIFWSDFQPSKSHRLI